MVPATQIAVAAKLEERRNLELIGASSLGNVAGEFARGRIVFAAEGANHANLLIGGVVRDALGKHPHDFWVLPRTSVSADNVIVQSGINIPSLGLCIFGEVLAAIEPLLLSGNRQKNNRCGKFQFAQRPCALQADGSSAPVVVRTRSETSRIQHVSVAGVVVARNQNDPLGVFRTCSFQNCVHICEDSWLRHARTSRLREGVRLHFEASAALARVALELALDPLTGCTNSLA